MTTIAALAPTLIYASINASVFDSNPVEKRQNNPSSPTYSKMLGKHQLPAQDYTYSELARSKECVS